MLIRAEPDLGSVIINLNMWEEIMKIIETKNAPGAIGPYSQAYSFNGMLITSGQLPADRSPGRAELPQCSGYH